jgi:hypothetical protein
MDKKTDNFEETVYTGNVSRKGDQESGHSRRNA